MTEIDIKSEIEKLNKELKQLVVKLNELDRQKQEVTNDIFKIQGAIEALQRLDTEKAK